MSAPRTGSADWLLADVLDRMTTHSAAEGELAAAVPVIRYDNVHEYWSASDKLYWSIDDDFPCIRPPFPVMWLLSGGARTLTAIEGTKSIEPVPVAVLCQSCPLPGGRIEVQLDKYMAVKGRAQFILRTRMTCDSDGRPINNDKLPIFFANAVRVTLGDSPDLHVLSEFASGFYCPALLAISFMHCKNVTMDAAPPSRSVSRALARRGLASERWYELVVGGITTKLDRERKAGATLQKALHICRGNFATYSESAPLFGKYVGRYWRPAHVRGAKEVGEVHKTYAVNASSVPRATT